MFETLEKALKATFNGQSVRAVMCQHLFRTSKEKKTLFLLCVLIVKRSLKIVFTISFAKISFGIRETIL